MSIDFSLAVDRNLVDAFDFIFGHV
jgi:hypothetical protein